MASSPLSQPEFGKADLSNCEREQIHLAASIQPHGTLLLVREPDFVIVQASANAEGFLGLERPLAGQTLAGLGGDLFANLTPQIAEKLDLVPHAVRCHIGTPPKPYDGLLHRPAGGGLVIELERAGPPVDLTRHVDDALQNILGASSLRALCDEAASIFRDLTGYDRVMVYRFDEEGHGEIFAELRQPHLEAFLGNRYPATDIPQIARRLYERNRVRVLVDVNYAPVPLVPRLSPLTGADLDMSLCFLRSHSPIHVQYLKNMGVGATLVVSLMVGGRLWGLVSCHHYSPRFIHFEMRAVCELLGEAVATRISALESFVQGQAELSVRRLEQRLLEGISREGDWRAALFDNTQALLQPLGASGAALLFEGEIKTIGEVPGTPDLRNIALWLDAKPRAEVFATAALPLDEPSFAALTSVASGIAAIPLSNASGDYLIWFRRERIRTVTWGGNPFKAVVIGDNPLDLSPRRSFAQWHQLVEGTSDAWTTADLTSARQIGATIGDVVLQFRSVRMLIAQDQVNQVLGQVKSSEQPAVIADAEGRILLINSAFEALVQATNSPIRQLDDLQRYFAEAGVVEKKLRALRQHGQNWRGEVQLLSKSGAPVPLLVRGDPVLAAQNRVLGYVIMFTDLTARKAAEAARRGFQDGILASNRLLAGRLDTSSGLRFQTLMSGIVENAQLAALEITDGADTAGMPALLESIRSSVSRTAEVLEHLIRHSISSADEDV